MNITNDNEAEGDETFTVRIFDVEDGTSTPPYTDAALTGSSDVFLTFTIRDNDGDTRDGKKRVTMSPNGAHTVDEYAGRVGINVRVREGVDETSTVRYEIEPVSATAVSDYEGTTGLITWPRLSRSQFFPIPIVKDLIDEIPNEETFIVRLTDPQGDVFLGDETTLTVTITDSDDPILRFEGPERVREPDNSRGGNESFGENYRLSVINSHGDLVTVGQAFDLTIRDNVVTTAPPGRDLALIDEPLNTVSGADYGFERNGRDHMYIDTGVIYDNRPLNRDGFVYHDTVQENEVILYTAEERLHGAFRPVPYDAWRFEDADPAPRSDGKRKTLTTLIVDNDGKFIDLSLVRADGSNATHIEVNEGDRVSFRMKSSSPSVRYATNFTVTETGGDHFPDAITGRTITTDAPLNFFVDTIDDSVDEDDSLVTVSLTRGAPAGFALRQRTVTISVKDNDTGTEPLRVDFEIVDENGVAYGADENGIPEGGRFRIRIFAEDGQSPLLVPVDVSFSLNVLSNRIDGLPEGAHTVSITIPPGETSAVSRLYTVADDNVFQPNDTISFIIISPASEELQPFHGRRTLLILENDTLAEEVFYINFVDGNGNRINSVTEGNTFFVEFEADNPVRSAATLTYNMRVNGDHLADFFPGLTQTRTVDIRGGSASVRDGPFTVIDDSQRDLPRETQAIVTLLPGAGYSPSSVSGEDEETLRIIDNDAPPRVQVLALKGSDRTSGDSDETAVTEGEDVIIRAQFAEITSVPRSYDVPVAIRLQTFGNVFEGFDPDEIRELTLTIPAGDTGAEMILKTIDNRLLDSIARPPGFFSFGQCGTSCGGAARLTVRQRPGHYLIERHGGEFRAVVIDNDSLSPPATPESEYLIVPSASSPVIEGTDDVVIRLDFVPPELESNIRFNFFLGDRVGDNAWFTDTIVGFGAFVELNAGTNTGSCQTSNPVPCNVSMDDSGATLTVGLIDNQGYDDPPSITGDASFSTLSPDHRYVFRPRAVDFRIVDDDAPKVIPGDWSVSFTDLQGGEISTINEGEGFSLEVNLDTANTYNGSVNIPVELTQHGGVTGLLSYPNGILQPGISRIYDIGVAANESSPGGFSINNIDNLTFHGNASLSARIVTGTQYNISPTGGAKTLTIVDDEPQPVPVSVFADREIINEGNIMFFTVVADSVISSTHPTQVTLAVTNEGRNWVRSPELLAIIPPNRNTGTAEAHITSILNSDLEGSVTVTVADGDVRPQLYKPTDVESQRSATVNVLDNGLGDSGSGAQLITLDISEHATRNVNEGENIVADFETLRGEILSESLTLTYFIRDDLHHSGFDLTDYVDDRVGTLTIPAGQRGVTLTFPTKLSNEQQPFGFVILGYLGTPPPGFIFNRSGANLHSESFNLTDISPAPMDAPTLTFSQSSYTVGEGDGLATALVGLSHAFHLPVHAQWRVEGGTARERVDFDKERARSSLQHLVFLPGQTEKELQVTIVDDIAAEDDETFNFRIESRAGELTNVRVVNPGDDGHIRAQVTITDNDGNVSVDVPLLVTGRTGTVFEGEQFNVNFSMNPPPAADSFHTITYTVSETGDFLPDGAKGTFTQQIRGDAGGESRITLMTVQDTDDEANGEISIVISPDSLPALPSGDKYVFYPRGRVDFAVEDDDFPSANAPSVRFSRSAYEVEEEAGVWTGAVVLSGATDKDVSVYWETLASQNEWDLLRELTGNPGVLVANDNQRETFIPSSGVVTVPAGSRVATFTVAIIDDPVYEDFSEAFAVLLTDPSGATLGDIPRAAVTVLPSDTPPMLSVAAVNGEEGVDEGGAARFIFTLDRPFVPHSEHTERMRVTYEIEQDGGFVELTDDQQAVYFVPGTTTAETLIHTHDDDIDEPDGSVTARLEDGAGRWIPSVHPANAAATVVVRDNDLPSIRMSVDTISNIAVGGVPVVTEGGSPVQLVFRTDSPVSDSFDVPYHITETGDYFDQSRLPPAVIESGETTVFVQIDTVDDDEDERTGEATFKILRAPPGFRISPDPAESVITITVADDDSVPSGSPTVGLANSAYTIAEDVSGGVLEATLTLSRATNSAVSVGWVASTVAPEDKAVKPDDFESPGIQILFFNPQETTKTVSIPIVDDQIGEPSETFSLRLGSPVNSTIKSGAGTAVVTITDDDESVSITSNFTDLEEGDDMTLTFSAYPTLTTALSTLTVEVERVRGGDHVASSNLGTQTLTVSLTDTATASIPTMRDTLGEEDGVVRVRLLNSGLPSGYVAPSERNEVVFNIADNDLNSPDIPLWLSTNGDFHPVEESAGEVTVTITLSKDPAVTAYLDWHVAERRFTPRATLGADFEDVSGTLTFEPGGSRLGVITIPIINDDLPEGEETFFIRFPAAGEINLTQDETVDQSSSFVVMISGKRYRAGSPHGCGG